MTRSEFLGKLREALEQELDAQKVQENLEYYRQYIEDEMRSGKSEQEVIEALGDPWIIARSIIDVPGSTAQSEYVYEKPEEGYRRQESSKNRTHIFRLASWWQILLFVLCAVGVLCLIVAVVTGIISLVAPILIPILIVLIVIRIFNGRRS